MTNKLEFKLNRDNLRADTDDKSTSVKKSFKMSENASSLDYKAMYADIINTFGYINNPIDSDAVYITKSGKFLDTKGPYNDHQHINIANYLTDKYHYKDADANNGSRFMSQIAHAIRVTCWNKGAGLKGIYLPKQEITQLQYDAIAKFANAVSKKVNKDNPLIVATENGSQQIEYTKSFKLAERVVNDIKYYYQTGKLEIVESLTESKAITWGDLDYAKKTDTRGVQMSGRGTGHFGTGFYFVGENGPYGINGEKFYDYEPSRPIYEIDLDKYNLFKPKDNDTAYKIHDAMRNINNYYEPSLDDWISNTFDMDKLEDELFNIGWTAQDYDESLKESDEDEIDEIDFDADDIDDLEQDLDLESSDEEKEKQYQEKYRKLIKEFIKKYGLEEYVWKDIDTEKIGVIENHLKDAIHSKYRSIQDIKYALKVLSRELNVSEDKLLGIIHTSYNNNTSKDTISTEIFKALGYEGVDVTHLNHDAQGLSGLDNFSYGTVIYDLKPGTFRRIIEPREKTNESLLNEDKVLRLPKDVTFQFINRLKDTYKGISLKELPIDKLVKDNDLLNDDDLESYHQGEWEHAKAKDFHIDKTKISGLRLGNTPFVVQKKDGTLKLSDGRHRTRAAYNDGYTHVEYPTYVEESLTEDENSKEDILDALDKEFGQEEVYMWSTYILPNGHFLNPDNSKYFNYTEPEYEHCDFEDWAWKQGYRNLNDIYNNCIKMNVTYPYLSMPDRAKPTQEQLNAVRKIIDANAFQSEGKFLFYDNFDKSKLDKMGSNLLAVYTPKGDEVFDLDVSDANDIIKAINQAYVRGGFFNESLKESVIPLKDCPTDIIIGTVDFTQYVKNKINNVDLRVFYDTSKDWYLVAPAYNSIHDDIIEDAINAGYYDAKNYDAKFTGYDLTKLSDFASYIHKHGKPFVICTNIENPEDIYPHQYKLNVEGTIVYVLSYFDLRELDFINNNLIEVLKEDLNEKIVKKGNKWQVQSEKGKNLGTVDTKKEAEKRLKQVHYFKSLDEEWSFDDDDIESFRYIELDNNKKYSKEQVIGFIKQYNELLRNNNQKIKEFNNNDIAWSIQLKSNYKNSKDFIIDETSDFVLWSANESIYDNSEPSEEEIFEDEFYYHLRDYLTMGMERSTYFGMDDFSKEELHYIQKNALKTKRPLYRFENSFRLSKVGDIVDMYPMRSFTATKAGVNYLTRTFDFDNEDENTLYKTQGSTLYYDIRWLTQDSEDFAGEDEVFVWGRFKVVDISEITLNKIVFKLVTIEQIDTNLKEHYFKHINEEDEDYIQKFKTRTQQHIDRVNKYAKKIDRSYSNHDSDKFNELFDGYSLMSKENVTEEEQKLIDDATYKHVLNNEHHCEHWCKPENIKGFSRKNPTPNGCLDCSKMPEYALEEMCCDWCAMSEEFNNTPFEWYEKNKDTRWHFNEEQDKFILDTLHKLWDTEKSFKHVNESKQDIEKFRQWAGEELADRFFAVKNRLEGKYKDIYYYMGLEKDTFERLIKSDWWKDNQERAREYAHKVAIESLTNAVEYLERTPTRKEVDAKGKEGAEKVYEDGRWLVLKINTYEASVKYGKHTQWCITGTNSQEEGGRADWENHEHNDMYFYIDKKNNHKYALEYADWADWVLYSEEDYVEVGKGIPFRDAVDVLGYPWNPNEHTSYPAFPKVEGLPDLQQAYRDAIIYDPESDLDVNDFKVESLNEDLTKEQEDYFKNSKIRDEKGNLLICYHGTENPGFKEFDARKGKSQFGDYKFSNYNVNYFTTNKETAVGYTDLGYEHDDNVYACYLNVVNPYIVNNRTEDDMYKTWQNIKDDNVREKEISYFNRFYNKWKNREKDLDELNKDLFYLNFKFVPNEENEDYYDLYELSNNNLYGAGHPVMYAYSLEEFFDDDQFVEFRDAIVGDYEGEDKDFFHYTVDNLIRWVLLINEEDGTNYDGIIVSDIYDIGPKGSAFTTGKTTDIITLKSSNQIKRIDNLKPTSNRNIDESRESTSFELGTAGYILPDGSFVYMDEYHGEDEKYRSAGHVEFSNTHCEEDTCVRIFKEPNEIQYKKLEEVIDKYLDEEEYCKVEINNDFYKVYSLREDACQDIYQDEIVGNWTGYKLVQIIRNYFNVH